MTKFIQVKCPHCHAFLKDTNVLLDKKESIKMNIEHKGKKGSIWLSSKYGSEKFTTDLNIKTNEIVDFSCPVCGKSLTTDVECGRCHAPMASFHLSNARIVNFCTRKGCNNNVIGELHTAEDELELQPKPKFSLKRIFAASKISLFNEPDSTYVHSFCPHCLKSLSDKNSVSLKLITDNNRMGFLILSPFLDQPSIKSTINIEDGELIKDLLCPYCNESLIKEGKSCNKCKSNVAELLVPANSRVIGYNICTKKGCLSHGLSNQDIANIDSFYHIQK